MHSEAILMEKICDRRKREEPHKHELVKPEREEWIGKGERCHDELFVEARREAESAPILQPFE